MKNNIIKFVSRNEFERRKFPLYAFSLVPHLDEMLIKAFRDGEDLDAHLTIRAQNSIRKLELSTGNANGVQG